LLQQSLVYGVTVEGGEEDGEQTGRRFNMLEMLREYASERLAEMRNSEFGIRNDLSMDSIPHSTFDIPNSVSRYHAEYYLAMAEAARPELRLAYYEKWCSVLESELDNIRAALEWSLRSPAEDLVLGVRLAGAMGLFWYGKGHHIEGIRWTQQLLARLDETPVEYHAAFLVSAGNLAWMSDLAEAQRLFTRALETSRRLGDKLNAAWALTFLGYVRLREPEVAIPTAEEGLALFRELNHLPGVAQNLNIIGEIARSSGDDEYARRVYEECLEICRQTGEARRIGLVSANLCMLALHERNYERALDFARQALQGACDRKNRTDMAFGLSGVAGSIQGIHPTGSASHRADLQRAARLFGASEAALERMGAFHQPADKPELARMEAAVRGQLDEATFRACWAEGREMTLDQAVADALDDG
jgi:tetratricopeptide (TPR) repeat protein